MNINSELKCVQFNVGYGIDDANMAWMHHGKVAKDLGNQDVDWRHNEENVTLYENAQNYVAEEITKLAADVLFLQEVSNPDDNYVVKALKDNYTIVKPDAKGKGDACLLLKNDTFSRIEDVTFTPADGYKNAIAGVKAKHKASGRTFLFVSEHAPGLPLKRIAKGNILEDPDQREAFVNPHDDSRRAILDVVDQVKKDVDYVVLGSDTNCISDLYNDVFQEYKDKGFVHTPLGKGTNVNIGDNTDPTTNKVIQVASEQFHAEREIDRVEYKAMNGAKIEATTVIPENLDVTNEENVPYLASDHSPLVTTLKFSPKPKPTVFSVLKAIVTFPFKQFGNLLVFLGIRSQEK